jgi:hypothetical protein
LWNFPFQIFARRNWISVLRIMQWRDKYLRGLFDRQVRIELVFENSRFDVEGQFVRSSNRGHWIWPWKEDDQVFNQFAILKTNSTLFPLNISKLQLQVGIVFVDLGRSNDTWHTFGTFLIHSRLVHSIFLMFWFDL